MTKQRKWEPRDTPQGYYEHFINAKRNRTINLRGDNGPRFVATEGEPIGSPHHSPFKHLLSKVVSDRNNISTLFQFMDSLESLHLSAAQNLQSHTSSILAILVNDVCMVWPEFEFVFIESYDWNGVQFISYVQPVVILADLIQVFGKEWNRFGQGTFSQDIFDQPKHHHKQPESVSRNVSKSPRYWDDDVDDGMFEKEQPHASTSASTSASASTSRIASKSMSYSQLSILLGKGTTKVVDSVPGKQSEEPLECTRLSDISTNLASKWPEADFNTSTSASAFGSNTGSTFWNFTQDDAHKGKRKYVPKPPEVQLKLRKVQQKAPETSLYRSVDDMMRSSLDRIGKEATVSSVVSGVRDLYIGPQTSSTTTALSPRLETGMQRLNISTTHGASSTGTAPPLQHSPSPPEPLRTPSASPLPLSPSSSSSPPPPDSPSSTTSWSTVQPPSEISDFSDLSDFELV